MELLYYALIIIFSCFVQAVAGFGLPMIALPLLVGSLGIRAAVPLIAIVILELQILMIIRYRSVINLRTVWRISLAAVCGIPVGVFFLSWLPEAITITLSGSIIMIYVLYALLKLPVPALKNTFWSYIFGFIGGIGGGAYNMASPPLIMYADTQRWTPQIFKANLQGIFLVISIVAITTHAVNGNLTVDVLRNSLIAIPLVVIGSFAGFYLDRYINPRLFRRIVLILLLLIGINLIRSGLS